MKHTFPKNYLLAIGALTLIGFGGCAGNQTPTGATGAVPANKTSDVDFAKTNFTALTEGDTTMQTALDWDNFKSSGINVGEIYAKMPDETQKSAFRESFIAGFSKSFKDSGARASDVSNWRVETESPAQTVVIGTAASGKTIAITVGKSAGERKMSALEIR